MISYQKKEYMDEEIYKVLHPFLRNWFMNVFGSFSAPQKYGIMPIHNQKNTLIFAPTGTGKTLTAFTSILNELVNLSEYGGLEDGVQCVYISPLKALSRDIKRNLMDPLKGIKKEAIKDGKKVDIRIEVRTGDTKAHQRSKMTKMPPHILITTPESFAILLTSPKFREHLRKVKWVIVDEIHALASSKRGVHLSLSLERLNSIADFVRIGLSATVSPLEEIAKFLVGKNEDTFRDCVIVDAQFTKKMDLKVLSPVKSLIKTPYKSVQDKMYRLIDELVQNHKTTLVFTNTRAATERVVHNLKTMFPKHYTENPGEGESRSLIGAHHGSLGANHRKLIEDRLKNGELKCIVSSTSLELGIDIGSIDLVILLGSPKSVARALQRIGRSGHRLDEVSKGRIIVLDRDDLVECSVLLKAAIEKKIDKVHIPKDCLDVLAQQIFGMAIEERRHIDEIFRIIKQSYNFSDLSRIDFDGVMDYLSGQYVSLEDRYVYSKIWHDEETGIVGKRGKLARVLYMTNVGTIPDESFVSVKLGDQVIGKIDESFLERLKKGDVFVLGGDTYEFQYVRGMTCRVRTSSGRPPTVPSWASEMLPLSFGLAYEITVFRRHMDELFKYKESKERILEFINDYLYVDSYGANSIYEYFREQFLYSRISHDKVLVVEHFKEDGKKYVVFHSLFGRRVNDVLSRALAYALSRIEHRDVEISLNDNGFMLTYTKNLNVLRAFRMIRSYQLKDIMKIALDKTEILKRRFRHCAARSLMILRNYKGKSKTVGRQQMSSTLLLNSVKQISEDFPILKEARREVLEDLMDIDNASKVLEAIEKKRIKIVESYVDFPSPFAFNLVMQGYSDIFKAEDRSEFLRRMHESVVLRIDAGKNEQAKELKFSYEKVWEEVEEKKRVMREEEQRELCVEAAGLDVPIAVRDSLIGMIADGIVDDNDCVLDFFRDEGVDMGGYPEGISRYIKLFLDKHDEKKILLGQLEKAYRKIRFDDSILFEARKIIIDGGGDPSREFRFWLENLLSGTIPYVWEKELVVFLRGVLEERR